MNKEEIFEKIKQTAIVILPDLDITSIKLNAHLRDDLGLDSVDAMSLIIALEQELGIVIPDTDVRKMTTIEQTVIVIEESMKKVG